MLFYLKKNFWWTLKYLKYLQGDIKVPIKVLIIDYFRKSWIFFFSSHFDNYFSVSIFWRVVSHTKSAFLDISHFRVVSTSCPYMSCCQVSASLVDRRKKLCGISRVSTSLIDRRPMLCVIGIFIRGLEDIRSISGKSGT